MRKLAELDPHNGMSFVQDHVMDMTTPEFAAKVLATDLNNVEYRKLHFWCRHFALPAEVNIALRNGRWAFSILAFPDEAARIVTRELNEWLDQNRWLPWGSAGIRFAWIKKSNPMWGGSIEDMQQASEQVLSRIGCFAFQTIDMKSEEK